MTSPLLVLSVVGSAGVKRTEHPEGEVTGEPGNDDVLVTVLQDERGVLDDFGSSTGGNLHGAKREAECLFIDSRNGGEESDISENATDACTKLFLEIDEGGKRKEATLRHTTEEDTVIAAGLTVSSHEDLVLSVDEVPDSSDGVRELSLVDSD